jgi:hypothetical protein
MSARPGPCGGRSAMIVPTAIVNNSPPAVRFLCTVPRTIEKVKLVARLSGPWVLTVLTAQAVKRVPRKPGLMWHSGASAEAISLDSSRFEHRLAPLRRTLTPPSFAAGSTEPAPRLSPRTK